MEILKVNLDNVTFSQIALRTHNETEDHIIELAIDIFNRGLLNLPTLVPSEHEEGMYVVSDGARRVMSLKLLKKGFTHNGETYQLDITELSFQIRDVQGELETLADQIAGNAQIKSTMKTQNIEAMYRIVSAGTFSVDELAPKIGMTPEYIWKLFSALRLPKAILERAEKEKVTITNLISLGQNLAGKIDDDEMEEYLDIARDNTVAEFAKIVDTKTEAIKKAAKGQERTEPVFELKPKLLSKDELTMMHTQAIAAFEDDPSPVNEATLLCMKKVWQVDEESAIRLEAEWQTKQDNKKAKAAERKAARDEAKLTDSIPKLEKEGYTVTAPKTVQD